MDFNNEWAFLDTPFATGLLFLSHFSFSNPKLRINLAQAQISDFNMIKSPRAESKANKNTLEFLNLAGDIKKNLQDIKVKNQNTSLLAKKKSKKFIQNIESFDFNLVQNYNEGLEVIVFRPLPSCDNSKTTKRFILELVILDFSDHKSFSGT